MSTSQPISVRPMTQTDVEAVAELYAANARDTLTPEQRSEHGFVQGRLDADALAAAAEEGRAFVAQIGGDLAGATMTHPVDHFRTDDTRRHAGPPALAVDVVEKAELPRPVLYGPTVVAEEYRRHGVLGALVAAVLDAAERAGYRTVVAFMELENRASVAAHAQLGWRSVGGFGVGEREYEVVVREVGKP